MCTVPFCRCLTAVDIKIEDYEPAIPLAYCLEHFLDRVAVLFFSACHGLQLGAFYRLAPESALSCMGEVTKKKEKQLLWKLLF